MRCLFFVVLVYIASCCFAQVQPLTNAATDAYVITRMVEKFHVQPRDPDDGFSKDMFNNILANADEERIYFTTADISKLAPYQFALDDELKQKKTTFLQLLHSIYKDRMAQVDSMTDNICKQPFNFSLAEKFTVAEDTSYPSNATAQHNKLYKILKSAVLESMLDEVTEDDALQDLSAKELEALEVKHRKKIQNQHKRSIKMKMAYPGGLPQMLGELYCSAVAACYDPHTEYLPLTEKENMEAHLGNNIFRFGFVLDEDDKDGGVVISNLKPGSPAFKSGMLNKGDKIMSLQWEGKERIDVSDASGSEVGNILGASNHEKIMMTVKKADGSVRELSLQKEALDPGEDDNRVKSFLLKGDKTIGYISLPAFYSDWDDAENNIHGCANDVATEIIKLQKENIEGLILDLRYNGGGSMQEAVELSGIFIDAGPVEQVKDREGRILTLKDMNRGTIYNGPLLLLVNGYSASASEVVAGTLQDYNRALIAGTPTYGKATSQVVFPLDTTVTFSAEGLAKKTDAYIKITVRELYRVNGATAQRQGVQPDIIIPNMLQATGERESDEPLSLNINKIDANKFYKPYPQNAYTQQKSEAAKSIAADNYFKTLGEWTNAYKSLQQTKDVSLKWEDALAAYKSDDALMPALPGDNSSFHAGFTVENNQYEKERIERDSAFKESNDRIRKYLSIDHSLAVAYKVVSVPGR